MCVHTFVRPSQSVLLAVVLVCVGECESCGFQATEHVAASGRSEGGEHGQGRSCLHETLLQADAINQAVRPRADG